MPEIFIYVASFVVVTLLLWIGYELYRLRSHMDGHDAAIRRALIRQRLSPQLFDQETVK